MSDELNDNTLDDYLNEGFDFDYASSEDNTVTCDHCEGTGEDENKVTCSNCNGEGELTFHTQTEKRDPQQELKLAYLLLSVNVGKQKDLIESHDKAIKYLQEDKPSEAISALLGKGLL